MIGYEFEGYTFEELENMYCYVFKLETKSEVKIYTILNPSSNKETVLNEVVREGVIELRAGCTITCISSDILSSY